MVWEACVLKQTPERKKNSRGKIFFIAMVLNSETEIAGERTRKGGGYIYRSEILAQPLPLTENKKAFREFLPKGF